MQRVNIFWFRRDLRFHDNTGLFQALKAGLAVVPIFIYDTLILDKLEDKSDARVSFIHERIRILQVILEKAGSSFEIFHSTPLQAFTLLQEKYQLDTVFCNTDYEPYARRRDVHVIKMLATHSVRFKSFKDHVIFEKDEIIKDNAEPYVVFTPYSRKWKALLNEDSLKSLASEKLLKNLLKQEPQVLPELPELGFQMTNIEIPAATLDEAIIAAYERTRDFPGLAGTSRLGVHLRFGTVSIRQVTSIAQQLSATFLSELIWREFYQMILWHFPRVGEGKAFKPAYENIEWRQDAGEFSKWCNGLTGYLIVDAGMRQLNATGFMHNRVRMITASFLCKHLLLDWRLGEAYFAEKLLDFDLASNNGGWQWAAGSGCDAAPYFRIFNPYLQTKKFDRDLSYIKKWVPEFDSFGYPPPIVEHTYARQRCLQVYSKALRNN